MDWHQLKQWLSVASGLNMDALHVYAGVAIQVIAALAMRRRLSSPLPLLPILLLVLVNEYYDLRYEVWPNRGDQFAESLRDGWNTLLMPLAILLLVRFAPRLFAGPEASPPDPGEPGS